MSESVKDDAAKLADLKEVVATAAKNSAIVKARNEMIDSAVALYVSGGRKTRENLVHAEKVTNFVTIAFNLGHPVGVAESMATEDMIANGVHTDDTQVQVNMQTYALAKLVTGADSVKSMPKEFIDKHSWRTLVILKRAVARDGVEYAWKKGYQDAVREWLDNGVTGKPLAEKVKKLGADIKADKEREAKSKMSREAVERAERKALNAKMEKLASAVNKSAEKMADDAVAAGFDRKHLTARLVNLGIIEPPPAKPTFEDLGKSLAGMLNTDNAKAFVGILTHECDWDTINTLASELRVYIIDNAKPVPDVQAKPVVALEYIEANVN